MFETDDAPPAIRASYTVLFAIGDAGEAGATAAAIAASTELHPRSVYRHLRSLRALGLVERTEEAGRFRLGSTAAALGARAAGRRSFLEWSQDAADEVTERAAAPAHVTVYDHGTAATVAAASVASARRPDVVPIVLGSRRPAHASASGKLFLAYSDAARDAYLLRPMEAFTVFTIADADELVAHCRRVRAQGWSSDVQENSLGISCLAVPVFGPRHRVVAAIVVSTASPELPPDRRDELLDALRPASARMARRIAGAAA